LIESGSAGKYILYAIGEIALVVIGILIALNINNWNEERREAEKEMQFLLRLEKDLISDTIYLNSRIVVSEGVVERNEKYIKQSYEVQENREDFVNLLRIPRWNSEHFVTQNSMYLELVNSGQIDILRNQTLKEKMVTFYKETEIAATHIKEYNEYTATNKLGPINFIPWKYLESVSDIFDNPKMFNRDQWKFVNNPESNEFRIFEDAVFHYLLKHQTFLEYFQDLKSKATLLIQDLMVEINEKK